MTLLGHYKYKPEYCKIALDILSDGYGTEEVCWRLKICEDTYYEWRNTHPDFKDATIRGRTYGIAKWNREGKTNVGNKEYNEKMYTRLTTHLYPSRWPQNRHVDLPGLADAKTYTEKGEAVIQALATGGLSPDEALKISQTVMNGATLKEKTELENRLVEVEKSVRGNT